MTVQLELKPEVEQRVLAHAEASGMTLESYLASVIETQVLPIEPPPSTLEEFAAALDALAEDSDDLPVMMPEALTREAIYGEHN